MRKICSGLLAAALVLGLVAVQPAQAKVYKMNPEERAQALKEKRAKRAKAKKSGKAAEGQGQGGWVEVKPGEKIAKKSRKTKVDEIAQSAEQKGKKSKKSKKSEAEAVDRSAKADKPAKKSKKAEAVAEKPAKAEKKGKKSSRKASRGDRLVGSSYGGDKTVRGTSTEVRRPEGSAGLPAGAPAAKADDLNAYSVSRPGQEKPAAPAAPAVIPEVRQEVQPGPLDSAKPVGTEQKGGEGRF